MRSVNTNKLHLKSYPVKLNNRKTNYITQGPINSTNKCQNKHHSTKLNQAHISLFKFNKRNTRKWCEICSKLTIKTSERGQ